MSPKAKGSAGEREMCDWLYRELKLSEKPKRNLEQTRSGGADIYLGNLVVEVKRCQSLSLRKWWVQVTKASFEGDERIVAFRQNRKPWRFLISAQHIGLDKGFIQLEEWEFSRWLVSHYVDDYTI